MRKLMSSLEKVMKMKADNIKESTLCDCSAGPRQDSEPPHDGRWVMAWFNIPANVGMEKHDGELCYAMKLINFPEIVRYYRGSWLDRHGKAIIGYNADYKFYGAAQPTGWSELRIEV
jgi:hypothetical protein